MTKILILKNDPNCCRVCSIEYWRGEQRFDCIAAQQQIDVESRDTIPSWCPLVTVTEFTTECPACGADNVVYTRAIPVALECTRCGACFETGFDGDNEL